MPSVVSLLLEGTPGVDGSCGDIDFPSTLQMLLLHDDGLHQGYPIELNSWREDHRVVFVERVWGKVSSQWNAGQWESGWIDGINGGEGFWRKGRIVTGVDHFSRR
jgi:hypothetical protein